MIRALPLAPLLFVAFAPAAAQERRFVVTNFDRVRVDGGYDVQLVTRGSPGAVAQGPGDATDQLDIRVEGTTLTVRTAQTGSGERPTPVRGRVTIRLSAPDVRSASVIGGGRLEILGPLKAARLDLQVTGSGSLIASGIANDQLGAVLLGAGAMTLGGQAGRVRLSVSGAGAIDAAALSANDLVLRLDGSGSATAAARYTANVLTTGVGAATVLGTPACTLKAVAGGPIRCGASAP